MFRKYKERKKIWQFIGLAEFKIYLCTTRANAHAADAMIFRNKQSTKQISNFIRSKRYIGIEERNGWGAQSESENEREDANI